MLQNGGVSCGCISQPRGAWCLDLAGLETRLSLWLSRLFVHAEYGFIFTTKSEGCEAVNILALTGGPARGCAPRGRIY